MPTSALVLLDAVQREKDSLHHTWDSGAKPASFLLHSHLNISRCLAGSDLQKRAEMSTTCPLFQLTWPLKLHMADTTPGAWALLTLLHSSSARTVLLPQTRLFPTDSNDNYYQAQLSWAGIKEISIFRIQIQWSIRTVFPKAIWNI